MKARVARRDVAAGLVLGTLVVGGLAVAPAQAAGDLVVTNTNDGGPGSLRQALADAAATPEDDTIVFDPTATGTIQLTTGQLDAQVGGGSGNLVIQGPGADVLTIDAGGRSSVLSVRGTSGASSFEVSGLGIAHGASSGLWVDDAAVRLADMVVADNSSGGDGWSPANGGGVSVGASDGGAASLFIDASTIEDNTASGTGGGVFAMDQVPVTITNSVLRGNVASSVARGMEVGIMRGEGGGVAAGDLSLDRSTVSDNEAQLVGGGIQARTLEMTGSTVSDNRARAEGGGVRMTGTGPDDQLSMSSSTVSGNRAAEGAGVHAASVPVNLILSTIASNAGVSGGGVFATGAVTLQGTALTTNGGGDLAGGGTASLVRSSVQDPTGFTTTDDGASVIGQDAVLVPLADNSGPTFTRLPAGNSPLIDQGSAFGATEDQRGSTRPVDDPGVANADDGSDIGAVEASSTELADPDQVANLTRPTVVGVVRVGSTLTTDGGTWEPGAEVTLAYQWLRDGQPIAGAAAPTYTLTPEDYEPNAYGEDLRKRISVRVTAQAPSFLPSVVESTSTPYVSKGVVQMDGQPKLRGKAVVGRTLRVKPRLGAVTPAGCSLGLRWFVGHRFVRRAESQRTLEVRPWMRGHRVKVNLDYRAGSAWRSLHRQLRTSHGVR